MKGKVLLWLLCAPVLFGSSVVCAQVQLDVTNMLRSLSGSLRGKEAQPQKTEGVTPVIGLRGMDEVDQPGAANASGADYVLMEGWAATKPEATAAAAAKGLSAQPAVMGSGKGSSGGEVR